MILFIRQTIGAAFAISHSFDTLIFQDICIRFCFQEDTHLSINDESSFYGHFALFPKDDLSPLLITKKVELTLSSG